MWKKIQTVVLLLAVTIGTGLLVSPYVDARLSTPPPIETTKRAGVNILRGDDDVEPGVTAKIVINAQEMAEVGELVRFDLTASTARSFMWLMVPEEVDFEIYDNGQRAVFSARKPGDYMFIIGCAYENTVSVAVHIVTVEGPVKPIDPVDPDDYPVVAEPDAKASLSRWVTYWCATNKRSRSETIKLADSFESVAAQIAAGTLQRADAIIKATASANRQALGDSLPDWLPVLQKVQSAMKILASQGELSTPSQHQALWGEIAKGLHRYESLFN